MDNIIYVCSGKGGVGKSTVAVNLAYALAANGNETGLYDADFQGPNVGSMIHETEETPLEITDDDLIKPGRYGGVDVFSMELIFETDEGIYLSGKHIEGAIFQTLNESVWDVDYLVVDLPPGTGEIHRTLLQQYPGKAALVTTPQKASQENMEKELELLERFNTDRLGLISNFTHYVCDNCGEQHKLLPGSAQKELLETHALDELLSLPFDDEFGRAAENGVPYVVNNTGTVITRAFKRAAEYITSRFSHINNVRPTGD